jgi:hypothetical protein
LPLIAKTQRREGAKKFIAFPLRLRVFASSRLGCGRSQRWEIRAVVNEFELRRRPALGTPSHLARVVENTFVMKLSFSNIRAKIQHLRS